MAISTFLSLYLVEWAARASRLLMTRVYSQHPGKSVFIYYTFLHLLGKGQPVALQRDDKVLIFREDGVKMHEADSDGVFFSRRRETLGSQGLY